MQFSWSVGFTTSNSITLHLSVYLSRSLSPSSSLSPSPYLSVCLFFYSPFLPPLSLFPTISLIFPHIIPHLILSRSLCPCPCPYLSGQFRFWVRSRFDLFLWLPGWWWGRVYESCVEDADSFSPWRCQWKHLRPNQREEENEYPEK